MAIQTGVVKVINGPNKFGGYGLMLEEQDGKWYNSKYAIKASKGDSVSFEDGGKNYVNKLQILGTGAPPTSSGTSTAPGRTHHLPVPLENSRAIIRQNALTNSNAFFSNGDMFPNGTIDEVAREVIRVARIFEEYTSGDSDIAAALKQLKDMEVE